jgi:hypothetical protein
MKTRILLLLPLVLSCEIMQEDIDLTQEPQALPTPTTSLQAVWERVQQSELGFVEFSREEDSLWVAAFVTSSDEGGNFYKELFVQDHPSQPQAALKIRMDRTSLVDHYPVGSRLLIFLNGLGAGMNNNQLTLGSYQGNSIATIPAYRLKEHFFRSDSLYNLIPKKMDLSALDPSSLGQWVQLEQVQFAKAEAGKTFSGEAFDEFDGERRLVQCKDQRSIFMSTSTFADYKSLILPLAAGNVAGLLTLDFYGEQYILKINDPTNIDFTAERCDPFFEESFDHVRLGLFDAEGWTNYNQVGTQLWEVYEDENSLGQSIHLGSCRSGDAATVSWLISPKIDLSSLHQPHFAFRTSTSFADNSLLEVFYSTNWSGETSALEDAQWLPLPARLATKEDDNTLWIDSGELPLTMTAPVYFAFRYTGSGKSTYDGTFEVDDIRVYDKAME